MSKLAKLPITLPKGVECQLQPKLVVVKGPIGELKLEIKKPLKLTQEDGQIIFGEPTADCPSKFLGLYRALIGNMVKGVSEGFNKTVELRGVGYRAAVQGDTLNLQLGTSHPTSKKIPKDISIKIEKNVLVIVSGPDKQRVGQFASELQAMRPPIPFISKGFPQGRGIIIHGQHVRTKSGKSGSK